MTATNGLQVADDLRRHSPVRRWLTWLTCFWVTFPVCGQVDPESRRLFQFGLNLPLEGQNPLGAYAFYYHNQPGFLRTNLTLRLAVAPVYLDSELGIREVFTPQTDLGFGISGGGFADTYQEVRGGKYHKRESFYGHAAEVHASLYHLFNPTPDGRPPRSLAEVPLQAVVRLAPRYSVYARTDDTSDAFVLPDDRAALNVRAGLRWGGREPLLRPSRAVELSLWYEGQFRAESQTYGYGGDRVVEPRSHLFWGRALVAYSFTNSHQYLEASITLGTSLGADRLSAYRVGGALPFVGEFPLMVPGYFFQEFSARRFALLSGNYSIAIPPAEHWSLMIHGATAGLDHLPGVPFDRDWISGVGGGIAYDSPSGLWQFVLAYGHGFQGLRHGDRGANAVSVLLQVDLERATTAVRSAWQNLAPGTLRGLQGIFGR